MLSGTLVLATFGLLALASLLASAYDPSPLQDFCVGIIDPKSAVFVNGRFCKNPKMVTPEDFFFTGLNIPRNTSNQDGSNVTLINVDVFPGLNTLGISLARIDYASYGGLNAPHTHPHATEVFICLEGTLYVGFVDTNPNNYFFSKILHPGDVFVFPLNVIHFQMNIGKTPAVALASLSSQNPDRFNIESAVFGSNPPIKDDVLVKAFQLDKKIVDMLQSKFWSSNYKN